MECRIKKTRKLSEQQKDEWWSWWQKCAAEMRKMTRTTMMIIIMLFFLMITTTIYIHVVVVLCTKVSLQFLSSLVCIESLSHSSCTHHYVRTAKKWNKILLLLLLLLQLNSLYSVFFSERILLLFYKKHITEKWCSADSRGGDEGLHFSFKNFMEQKLEMCTWCVCVWTMNKYFSKSRQREYDVAY